MAQAKTKNVSSNIAKRLAPVSPNDKDQAMADLISGINRLIAHSEIAQLGTACRILHHAKDELVHWAVNMDFHESKAEKFINKHLYGNTLLLKELLAAITALEEKATDENYF